MRKVVNVAIAASFLVLGLAPAVHADYIQDFDGLAGSPEGVILTGQDGYYLPNGPSQDVDFKVYTYAGNVLGIVDNPGGGSQFIAGTGPGGGLYARAQRNEPFGPWVYEASYDFCGIYVGAPPGSNNIGSFSTRAAGQTGHINLFTWVDPNNPVAINSTYIYYDANNVQSPTPGTPPGPEWSNLSPNHWYRCRTVMDLSINQIVEIGIRDLSGGTEAVYNPTDWYLYGGANPTALPDGFRWFGGGGSAGNSTAWDNAYIAPPAQPEGACCFDDGTCIVTIPEECTGEYMGDGTSCDPNPCGPNPVEITTWGAIKNSYR